jgi:hypothetical protein
MKLLASAERDEMTRGCQALHTPALFVRHPGHPDVAPRTAFRGWIPA